MQSFAGKEIVAGHGYQGWTSHFWPPLFSLLIGLGSLFAPGFLVGKLISIIASTILLWVVYQLAVALRSQVKVALLTQMFLVLNPLYFKQALQAHNHMLNALLVVTGLWLFMRSLKKPTSAGIFGVGLVSGLAALTRFTSYVLLALPLFSFIAGDFKTATKWAVVFWAGFAVVSSPWWYYNTVTNGSPLYNWEQLNVCESVVPGISGGGGSLLGLWQCANQYNFNGILDIFVAYPIGFIYNFYQTLIGGVGLLMKSVGVLVLFVIPALFNSLLSSKSRYWFILYGELSLYLILVSQAFIPDYDLLGWTILMTIASVTFAMTFLTQCQKRYRRLENYQFRSLSLAFLMIIGLLLTFRQLGILNDAESSWTLANLDQVTQALREYDPNIQTKVIMAIDPARAYYAGSKFILTPLDYEGSVDGLVSYRGLSERIKTYAPKYPSTITDSEFRTNYLIYVSAPSEMLGVLPELPQFSFLLDPSSVRIPQNFKLVYHSANVVVYEIK